MLLLMFVMLKRIIKILNTQSKTYFINKIQNYDELIEAKENKLLEINNKIKELEGLNIEENYVIDNKKDSLLYEQNIPSYRDDKFFKNYKKINEKFNIDNIKIIDEFINKNVLHEESEYYIVLLNIKNMLNYDRIYSLIVLDEENQLIEIRKYLEKSEMEVVKKYIKEKGEFDILSFLSYIDDEILKNDPTIYVKVGNKEENYNHLNKFIKTVFDDSICMGVIIIYKNKLYDYSLS